MAKMKEIKQATDAIIDGLSFTGDRSAWVTPSRKRWEQVCRQVLSRRPDAKVNDEGHLIFARTGAVIIPVITEELTNQQPAPRLATIH